MIYVLFSGGIDSLGCLTWAAFHWGWENVTPVYCRIGSVYEEQELKAVDRLLGVFDCPRAMILDLQGLKEDKQTAHVPFRNLSILLKVAALPDCNGIVFGMLMGEASEDKGWLFARRVQMLIRSQLAATIYSPGRKFSLYTPFAWKTKAGVVDWLVSLGLIGLLPYTYSCYSGDAIPCGVCMACLRRWVALPGSPNHTYRSHPAEWALRSLFGESVWHDGRLKPRAWRVPNVLAWPGLWQAWRALSAFFEVSLLRLFWRQLCHRGK